VGFVQIPSLGRVLGSVEAVPSDDKGSLQMLEGSSTVTGATPESVMTCGGETWKPAYARATISALNGRRRLHSIFER
jgi:hypothetical protein